MCKKLKKKVICFVLMSVTLIGSALTVYADTPVCGGNHSYSKVRTLNSESSQATSHHHDGKLCFYYYVHERVLERCTCVAERVNKIDCIVHEKTDINV